MSLFNYSVCNWTSNVLTENTHCCSFILFLPPHFLPILFSSSPSFVTISSSFLPPLFSSHPSSYRSPLPLHLLLLTHPQLLLHLCHLSSEAELLLMERCSGLRLMELQWHLVVKCQNCNRTGDKETQEGRLLKERKQNYHFNNNTFDDIYCLDTSSEHSAGFEVICVSVFTSSVSPNVIWLLVKRQKWNQG